MFKKRILSFLLCLLLVIATGCGEIDPSIVDKEYVQNKIEKALKYAYGVDFIVNVTSLDLHSEKKESTATAYPKNDPSLVFEATGYIGDDFLSATRAGSSYHIKSNFAGLLWAKINDELNKKGYSFEIGAGADYSLVASNIRDYLKQLRILLNDYKSGNYIKSYFSEEHQRGYIPLTLNMDDIKKEIIIDSSNGKVIIDTTQSDHGWQGELEVEEYLQLLADGQLEKKIDEIRCGYGYSPLYSNSCEN